MDAETDFPFETTALTSSWFRYFANLTVFNYYFLTFTHHISALFYRRTIGLLNHGQEPFVIKKYPEENNPALQIRPTEKSNIP